ncbi:MAG: cytochrome c [Candidatus Acidiferrales bacterium]|jgi:mono/diheme cytochrome c family protein
MRTAGTFLAAALLAIFAALAVAAQEQRITSSWTPATVSGQGQPRGYVEYQKFCSACHGEGVGKPGTLALQAKYKGAVPALLDKRTDLTPEFVKMTVRNGVTVMPFFRKTEISDADLNAIAAYLTRNNKP